MVIVHYQVFNIFSTESLQKAPAKLETSKKKKIFRLRGEEGGNKIKYLKGENFGTVYEVLAYETCAG